jgi:hypothetical protein
MQATISGRKARWFSTSKIRLSCQMEEIKLDFDDSLLKSLQPQAAVKGFEALFSKVYFYHATNDIVDEFIVRINIEDAELISGQLPFHDRRVIDFTLTEAGAMTWDTLVPCPLDLGPCRLKLELESGDTVQIQGAKGFVSIVELQSVYHR